MAERQDERRGHLVAFGARVRLLRNRLTPEALAHEAGLHRAEVGFLERGERDFGITVLWPLADALGVPVADLFSEVTEPAA
jgi:transcriptional regulator with XRE-family HTH domain